MNIWKKVILIIVVVLLLISIGGFIAYKVFGDKVVNILYTKKPGNAAEYSLDVVELDSSSPLKDKTIIFLGSSVTEGYGSGNVSFVEFLEKKDGVSGIKETKDGTTLVNSGNESYIQRMEKIDGNISADAFVCQLSTNDASKRLPLGEVSASNDKNDFDQSTIAGSIEYIISYAKETWNCPVVFYTSPKYDSDYYQQMVDLLLKIQKKWDIKLLDLWNDNEFNSITDDERSLYMIDGIHPTKAGYLKWWLPKFEDTLEEVMKH